MKQFIIFYLCLTVTFTAAAQLPVKFDSLYKKIYAKDLCKLALSDPGLLLIDVRSQGEYSDTSQYNSLNMGHLKSAINIPVDSIQKNVAVLNPYKNKTLVFYCSHSQRSRRVSKLLSENGFTNYYNLNGGMSQLNQMTAEEFPCKSEWLVSGLPYKNLSSADAIDLIKNNPDLIIMDIRSAAMFNSKDSLIENNIGHIKNAINIPYAEIKARLVELVKYKQQPLLVYSESGDGDAARTAVLLTNSGFIKVYHLLAGFNDLLIEKNAAAIIDNPPAYHLTDAAGVLSLLKNNKQLAIYDTRPEIEFANKLTGHDSYKNLGNIKNAIHLEQKDFDTYTFPAGKNAPLLIYGRAEAFRLANKLSTQGYKNVYVMYGLYDMVSSAFNIESCKDALQYLENHEGIY